MQESRCGLPGADIETQTDDGRTGGRRKKSAAFLVVFPSLPLSAAEYLW